MLEADTNRLRYSKVLHEMYLKQNDMQMDNIATLYSLAQHAEEQLPGIDRNDEKSINTKNDQLYAIYFQLS